MTDTSKKTKKEKIIKFRRAGLIMAFIQLFFTIIFIREAILINVLSLPILAVVILLLLAINVLDFFMMKKYPKKQAVFFWIIAVLMTVLVAVASFYLWKTRKTLSNMSSSLTSTATVGVYVKKDDPAKTLEDAAGYKFGILKSMDRDTTDKAVKMAEENLESGLDIQEYDSPAAMADAIRGGDIEAMFLNTGYTGIYNDMEEYSTFPDEIRELTSFNIKVKLDKAEATDVSKPFVMYISGIDTFGKVNAVSRSDVNILAAFNPSTGQVLLVNTPRDYYVPLSISGGTKDKLTHAGIYGIDCSKDTLGMLYDVDVDHYFRLNFSGFEGIIDALGGIDVDSDVAFSSFGYDFKEGTNHVNGEQALAFARERHSFASGDNQRGQNQMKVIEGVIKKAESPSILSNYLSVLDSMNGTFDTDLSYNQITSLIKNQISGGTKWNVTSYAVTGSGSTSSSTYSMPGHNLYVMEPDNDMVKKGSDLIDQVLSGETPVVE